jgi:hypothetical protein
MDVTGMYGLVQVTLFIMIVSTIILILLYQYLKTGGASKEKD